MSDLVLKCSWCERIKEGNNWLEKDLPKNIEETHGICEDCYFKFYILWEQEEVERRTLV